jgi:hypothetical protein
VDGRDEPYVFCYLYKYVFDLAADAGTLTLPDNDSIHIFRVTLADNPNDDAVAAGDLYDRITPVRINPRDEVYVGPISVVMSSDDPRTEIRYTIDGREPTASAHLYRVPLLLEEAAIIKARSFAGGKADDYVASRRYTVVQPLRPDPNVPMVRGLNYRYFEEKWKGFQISTP